jgi:hypothetical protein
LFPAGEDGAAFRLVRAPPARGAFLARELRRAREVDEVVQLRVDRAARVLGAPAPPRLPGLRRAEKRGRLAGATAVSLRLHVVLIQF